MSVINLGRTTKTNIAYYHSDGMGRDGYITYNDGGFWKDKYIKSSVTQRNNHKFLTLIYFTPKK